MLRRVEEEPRTPTLLDVLGLSHAQAIVPAVAELETETPLLPRDHPQWVKDALSISNRAKELLARIKPAAIAVLCFWDHRIRSVLIGNARVLVDPSGSYRAE